MPQFDQFASRFKAAAKDRFVYRRIDIARAALVTDRVGDEADALLQQVRGFLSVLGDDTAWSVVDGAGCETATSMMDTLSETDAQLIVTYRNLHQSGGYRQYTLGKHVDVLTQVTPMPVLILPHPEVPDFADRLRHTQVVMAMTDHLTGDDRLVNTALRLVQAGGRLMLTHVEDDRVFSRYLNVIEKIPSIDTDNARKQILRQIQKEPSEYIDSAIAAIADADLPVAVEKLVTHGRRLEEYRKLVEQRGVDLLVMHTKDEDQTAMHGMAYPLAIELRNTPLLAL